jgi:hypothetical protein
VIRVRLTARLLRLLGSGSAQAELVTVLLLAFLLFLMLTGRRILFQ